MPLVPTDSIPIASLPTDRRAMLAGIGGLAAGALLVGKASAGPLDPPPGPVAPTPGPEPRIAINQTNTPGTATALFRITQPGSYYLNADLAGVAGRHGIEIASNNVTIDLMGFELVGVPGSLDGISSNGNLIRTVTISNGAVRDWGQHGVSLVGFFHRATGLFVSGCGESGLNLALNATIEGCRASACGARGMKAGDNAVLRACTAHTNTQTGIEAGEGALIESCLSQGNAEEGFQIGVGSVVRSCVGKDNAASNFSVRSGSTITDCSATGSTGGSGFEVQFVTLVGCVASDNAMNGIDTTNGAVVTGCLAFSNASDGIRVGASSIATECQSNFNGGAGIDAGSGCSIARNQCTYNLGAGIETLGSGTRIEDNACADNAIGIKAALGGTVGGAIIIRNTCHSNSLRNWDIAAGCKCLVVNGTNAGAIQGNSGGVSPGSTDPNANYTL